VGWRSMTACLMVLPHVGQVLSTTKFIWISFRSGRTEDTQKGPQRLWCCEDARTPCDGISIELS